MHTYILHDRVFCARCTAQKPAGLTDAHYGKMRPSHDNRYGFGRYRCLCVDRGYSHCGQPQVRCTALDEELVGILSSLIIPGGLRERVENAVRNRVENEAALNRMAEIQEIVSRIDFSWENGFLGKEEYLEKRTQLQREIESLRPIDYDELT